MRLLLLTNSVCITTLALSRGILGIAPWVQKEKLNSETQMDFETLPHWCFSRETLSESYEDTKRIYYKILPKLASLLNEKHGLDKPVEYWELVIGYWLQTFIEVAFDRWKQIESIPEDEIFEAVCMPSQSWTVCDDSKEFLPMPANDDWNFQLLSQLLFITKPANVRFSYRNHKKFSKRSSPFKLRNILSLMLCLLGKLNTKIFVAHVYFRSMNSRGLFSLVKFFPVPFLPTSVSLNDYDCVKRKNLLLHEHGDNEENIIFAAALLNLPLAFLENFEVNKFVAKHFFPKKVCCSITSVGWVYSVPYCIWLGDQRSRVNNFKFYIFQHGGTYGLAQYYSSFDLELRICSRFLTYGWTHSNLQTPAKLEQMFFDRYQLAEDVKRHVSVLHEKTNKKTWNVLVILNVLPRYPHIYYSLPTGMAFASYMRDISSLLNLLDENGEHSLGVRFHKIDYGWSFKEYLRRANVRFETVSVNEQILKQICRAKLTIVTFNTTTLIEAMYLNMPTLVLFDRSMSETHEQFEWLFDMLKSEKIFFEIPEDLVDHYTTIRNDVERWWLSSKVQKARSIFCENFAVRPDCESKMWKSVFEKDQLFLDN